MGNPLANRTVTVPAGATGERLHVPGRYVKIVSVSVASVLMGFDDSSPERVYPDDCYAGPAEGFQGLRFVADVGACTVVVQISEQPILGGTLGTLAPIAASLQNIDNDLDRLAGVAALTILADTLVAQTGGVGTQLFAANANRRIVQIQALDTNTGYVYLGTTNAVTSAAKLAVLAPGASWYDEFYQGAVFAVGNDALQSVCGYEE